MMMTMTMEQSLTVLTLDVTVAGLTVARVVATLMVNIATFGRAVSITRTHTGVSQTLWNTQQ